VKQLAAPISPATPLPEPREQPPPKAEQNAAPAPTGVRPAFEQESGGALVEPARQGSLRDEAAFLARARQELATDPARALEILKRHETEFPKPRLFAEREVLAVESLLRLGRRTQAEARARKLMNSAPNGIYARRLERLLTKEP
jgi:hypothetical protein